MDRCIGTQVRSVCPLYRFYPGSGSIPPSAMAHSKSAKKLKKQQHLMCERRLQDVAASLQQGVEQHSEMRMVGIVRHEMKLYSRNNRMLWCFKEASFSARSDDTDRWLYCDCLPTDPLFLATTSAPLPPCGCYFVLSV